MTRQEAANYIGISLSHFATLQNKIPQIRLGANVRFRKSEIDNFLNSNTLRECKYCGKPVTGYCCESCYDDFETETEEDD